ALVVERRAGAMSVDVIDVVRIDLAVLQGRTHGARGAARIDGGDVAGIGAHAEAKHFGIDRSAACDRMIARLQHEHGRALAEHESGARSRKRPARIRAEHAQSFPALERAYGKAGFRAAGERDRRLTGAHHLKGLADGMRAGRAGRRDRIGRPLQSEIHRDCAAGGIRHQPWDRQRMRARRVLSVELEEGIVERVHAAGRIADDGRGIERDLFGQLQLRVAQCRARGDDGKLREAVEQALAPGIEMLGRLEIEHLGRDADIQPLSRNESDRADAGAGFDQGGPECVTGIANRSDHSDSRDDDPIHFGAFAATSFSTISATSPTVVKGSSESPLLSGLSLLSSALRSELPSVLPDAETRVASLACKGMAMSYFSSSANTISMTSSDSAPNSSRRLSGVSWSTGMFSDLAMMERTSSIIANVHPRATPYRPQLQPQSA